MIDIESLKLHEELRQLNGICQCCELLNKSAKLRLNIKDEIKEIRLTIIPGFCPVCGKKICELLNKSAESGLNIKDEIKEIRLTMIPGFCPVCGKKIKEA